MKIAKKMLAVLVVLTMVAAFAAVAFAADPHVTISVGEYKNGKANVSVKLTDCIGLTSGSLEFAYPSDKNVTLAAKKTKDQKAIANGDFGNDFNGILNETANPAGFGFNFLKELWSTEDWAAADEEGDAVNGENFECLIIEVACDAGTTFTVTGDLVIGENENVKHVAVNQTFTVGKAAADTETTTAKSTDTETTTAKSTDTETTTAKSTDSKTETTTAKSTDTEPPTAKSTDTETTTAKSTDSKTEITTAKAAPGKKTDGGKKTGDNSVLAVMAGVVALAGAAFVVTKKRK